jgi:drug/metabolite transporter (DMT)-like permease
VGDPERTSRSHAHPLPAELAALLTVAIWGTSFSFQKVALEQFNVLGFIALRYLGMLVLSWSVLLFWQRRTRQAIAIKRADLAGLALTGGLGYGLYIPLSTVGLSYTTAFSNALLIATSPLFAALLLRMLRTETIGMRHYLGMLLSGTGVALFVIPAIHAGAGGSVSGDLISLAAALFFAAYTVTSKRLLSAYPLLTVMTYTLSLGTVPVILLLAPQIFTLDWIRINGAGWAAFAWTVVVPVYVAWTIWGWTVARIGVARSTLFMYLVPIIGGLTSWLLLGEGFGALKIAGASLTLAGLAMARRPDKANPDAPLAATPTRDTQPPVAYADA